MRRRARHCLELLAATIFALACVADGPLLRAQSMLSARLDDSSAVYLDGPRFHARGDGQADDTAALQGAIDAQFDAHREGIVFVPEGRYRLTHTVYVWTGVRLIGYGRKRPTFVLGDNTPGYNNGIAYMLFFAGDRPEGFSGAAPAPANRLRRPPTPPGTVPMRTDVPDANPGTFYSGLSNIDFQVGSGNSGAVAVRFHAAQHALLSHIDFHMGSGFAGLHEVGNLAEDLHFFGGEYGIMARKPSPAWQFTLLDSTFEGQRAAAIRENEAGLTLVNITFRDVPTAVSIDEHFSDQLWIKNSRFERISGPALEISNEASRITQINVVGAVCEGVPVFAKLRESGKSFSGPAAGYRVMEFAHGLTFTGNSDAAEVQSRFRAEPVTHAVPLAPVIPAMPASESWVNVHTLGVRGDGTTDDTAALQRAIDTHVVLYLPGGRYLVTDTLRLRADSVLIGLHPSTTQIDLPENLPAFRGPGAPRPLLLSASGGNAQVRGIGLFTGGLNGRAVGLLWRAGAGSLVDDVRFLGGHGTNGPDGRRLNPYNSTHSADPDPHKPWNSQYPSLWVDGGGGTFANIWTPDTFAQAGLLISNTDVPGFVYELSSEHHVQAEIKLRHVAHWELYALQTEEESGESQFASSLEIDDSHDLTIANYHGYRVTHSEQPFPYAVRVARSQDVRFRNIHVDSNSSIAVCDAAGVCRQGVRPNKVPFENSIVDDTQHRQVRDREFAWLDLSDSRSGTVPQPSGTGALHRLTTGFFNASGAAVDGKGRLYFVDARFHRIERWSPESGGAEVVRDAPLQPVNLVFDKAGDLIVLSNEGVTLTAYAIHPDEPQSLGASLQVMDLQTAAEHTGMTVAMPVDYWFNGDFRNTLSAKPPYTYTTLEDLFHEGLGTRTTHAFVAPDASLFIPTNLPIVQGEPYFGTKWAPVLYSYGLVKAVPGSVFYATNEAEQRTYRGTLRSDGSLADIKVFLERGGESLATDSRGNVYVAAGQIYVYSPNGKLLSTIRCPERPHDILFGGDDGQTLYILSEHSLFETHAIGQHTGAMSAGRRGLL